MFCKNCGSEINEKAVVCVHCGCPVQRPQDLNTPKKPEAKTNVLAIVGFVLSFLIPLAGLICSALGIKNADKSCGGSGKGLAIAGVCISSIALIVSIALYIHFYVLIIEFFRYIFYPPYEMI